MTDAGIGKARRISQDAPSSHNNIRKFFMFELKDIMEKLERIESLVMLGAKNVLSVEEVATLTGFSKSHIYKLTCYNEIPFYKPNSKNIYFDKAEIEAWMKRNRVNTTEEAEQQAAAYQVRKDMKLN